MVADSRQQSGRQEMSKTDNPGLWTKALMPQEGARVRAASLCVCLCGGDRAERKRGFLGTHQVRGSQPTLVARAAPPPLCRTPQIPLFTPVPPTRYLDLLHHGAELHQELLGFFGPV